MQTEVKPEVGSAYGRYLAARAGFSLQRLIHLDDLWTADLLAASGRGQLNESELEALQQIAFEMERELEEGRRQRLELRMMLNDAGDEQVNQAFEAIVDAEGLPGPATALRSALEDYEIRSAAIAGCDYMEAMADEEAALLRKKVATILNEGEVPPGDLRAPFRCAALIALVGAGTVSMIGLGGPVGFVAVGAISQVGLGALAWMQENCGAQIKAITFARRE